jgi:hypothetical protein
MESQVLHKEFLERNLLKSSHFKYQQDGLNIKVDLQEKD